MNITKFAVKYPVSVLMLTLGVCLLGIISYNKLGTDLFPELKNPALYIELEAGERPPEEIEKQFVEKIESAAARQEGVKQVSSSSKVGGATITVEYDWDQDMDAAFLDLQRSMSQIGQNEEITSLNVSRYDANATPVMIISMNHKEIKDMNELRKIAENYMRSELVRLDGVADIQLNGQEEAYVEVKTNSYMLEAFKLTAETIASKIEGMNRNVSGGTIVNNDIQYTIKGVNLLKTIEDIFVATDAYLAPFQSKYKGELYKNQSFFQEASFIMLDRENISRKHVDTFLSSQDFILHHVIEVNNMDLSIEFAKAGLGIACVIGGFVEKDIKNCLLREVKLGHKIPKRQIGFAYLPKTPISQAMDILIQYYQVHYL